MNPCIIVTPHYRNRQISRGTAVEKNFEEKKNGNKDKTVLNVCAGICIRLERKKVFLWP